MRAKVPIFAHLKIMRWREIDIIKGVAMLLVMLGHSFLQQPFYSLDAAPWSRWLNDAVYSFHMPLFFVVSGFLFNGGNEKPVVEAVRGKAVRLLVPYLCVTIVVMAAKLFSPSGMASAHSLAEDLAGCLKFIFLDCGNRWFVYVLFIIFVVAILTRKVLRNRALRLLLVVALSVSVSVVASGILVIDLAMRFFPFFLIGMWLREHYDAYCRLMERRWFIAVSAVAFFVMNILLVPQLSMVACFKYVFMPITGVNATWIVCYHLREVPDDKCVMRYLLYVGRYSLQFYLLLFPVAVIGYLLGVVLHVTDVAWITVLMFVGQVISITALVEITRRIPWLKYPLGY